MEPVVQARSAPWMSQGSCGPNGTTETAASTACEQGLAQALLRKWPSSYSAYVF